ncbi:DUF2141 domain-containing protein [Cellvibrio sp. KY-GH-1]|uniref:DUF2141 domain-containing protein n=1 Tax=Cellvibrio sp. KY-GH-1 TaxID=2303332 RepID=UPI0012487E8B|nr:DUF2141 domain-containing protein [Cellvibrio sp. KY-GH-1]QEY18289.1 DUF2141 domain-containing protein [Cellvibrio sp. KY-GH-1]
MKKYLQLLTCTALVFTVTSPNLVAAELTVEVNKIQHLQGSLYISLYKDAQCFDSNNNAVKREKISVDKTSQQIKLGDVPAGDYALRVYQDVNDNGKMDFNGMLPAEPFGSSSKSTELAPPSFNDAKFTLDKSQKVQIQLLK